MKHLFQSVTLLVIAGSLFLACKKPRCESCETNQPATNNNKAPIAKAGNDTVITLPTNALTLDGSASTDPDNNITKYGWVKISGPASFNIANANSVQTQVTNLAEGTYLFELKVTDAGGLTAKDTVQVSVMPLPHLNLGNVFIAGWGRNDAGKMIARIWGENSLQDLSDGQYDAHALSVFVSGTDEYVAGWESNASGKTVAKLWKNGVVQSLSNGLYDAVARSVFKSGTDVYVAGWENNTNSITVARLWKNGVIQTLVGNEQWWSRALSVFVSGTDVYVAGHVDDTAVIWKNGVPQQLNRVGEGDVPASVFVSGSDVYAAGGAYSCCPSSGPVLWKNGVVQNLENSGNGEGDAFSVFVSGSDVYVTGWSSENGATLWKNGVAQKLNPAGNGNAQANAVFVNGSDVYVAGMLYGFTGNVVEARLWINAVAYTVHGLSEASSVFVK